MTGYDKRALNVRSGMEITTKEQLFDRHIVSPCDEVITRAIAEGQAESWQFKIVSDAQNYADHIKESHDYERAEVEVLKTDRSDLTFYAIKGYEDGEDDYDLWLLAEFD